MQAMITKEQAIAELRAMIKHISDGYSCRLAHGWKADNQVETEFDALQFAVNELEKQIPQKPIEDDYYGLHCVCPCCGQALYFSDHLTKKGGVQE